MIGPCLYLAWPSHDYYIFQYLAYSVKRKYRGVEPGFTFNNMWNFQYSGTWGQRIFNADARQDYLDTARAKGVSERNVVIRHALKNAMIPIATIAGTQVATNLGGAVLTETVFAWPGIGKTIVDAVNQRDVPMVTGCIVLVTILVSLVVLAVDLLYALIDPRIKAQYAKGGKR